MASLIPSGTSVRPLLLALLPLAVLLGLFYLGGKVIEVHPPARPSVTGYGEGRIAAKPDTAEITLGVQTGRQPTAERAMQLLNERMDAVLKALRGQGVEDAGVRTTGISLYPAYDWIDGQQVSRGFEAGENVVVTVRDIGKTGPVISVSTKAGANQVTGVRFYLRDMTELRRQARKEAVAKAKQDAAQLAADMGVRLGRLAQIDESVTGPSGVPMGKGGIGMGGGGDAAVPSGEEELTVGVSLTYELR